MREQKEHRAIDSLPTDNAAEPQKTVLLRIPARMHRALRVRVAEEGTTIRRWVTARIEDSLRGDGLSPHKQP